MFGSKSYYYQEYDSNCMNNIFYFIGNDECQSLQNKACRLCLCCKGCPCTTNVSYFVYIGTMVGGGLLLLYLIVTKLFLQQQQHHYRVLHNHTNEEEENNSVSPSFGTTTLTKKKMMTIKTTPPPSVMEQRNVPKNAMMNDTENAKHPEDATLVVHTRQQTEKVPTASLKKTLSKKDIVAVRKAIDLWEKHDVLDTCIAEKLRITTKSDDTTTTKNDHDDDDDDDDHEERLNNNKKDHASKNNLLAAMLIVCGFVIILFESTTSETILYDMLFRPWIWILGEEQLILGKSFTLLILGTVCHYRRGNKNTATTSLSLELIQVFFVMAYIGAITYSVVDTGSHKGETTTQEQQKKLNHHGSNLWYATVGTVGSVAILLLSNGLPSHYYKHSDVWISLSLSLLLFKKQDDTILFYWACLLNICFILIGMTTIFSRPTTLTTIGSALLIATIAIDEIFESNNSNIPAFAIIQTKTPGALLAVVSICIMFLGSSLDSSTVHGAVSSMGLSMAIGIANNQWRTFFGLNAILRLIIFFTFQTVLIGGWRIKPFIRMPPKTQFGVSIVLVFATNALLLITVVMGNSHKVDEWKTFMDWESINGTYEYNNRLIHILPWLCPFFLYYTALCRYWPEMEKTIHPYYSIRIAVCLGVMCHVVRVASWSLLFLIVAGVTIALPSLERLIQGEGT